MPARHRATDDKPVSTTYSWAFSPPSRLTHTSSPSLLVSCKLMSDRNLAGNETNATPAGQLHGGSVDINRLVSLRLWDCWDRSIVPWDGTTNKQHGRRPCTQALSCMMRRRRLTPLERHQSSLTCKAFVRRSRLDRGERLANKLRNS